MATPEQRHMLRDDDLISSHGSIDGCLNGLRCGGPTGVRGGGASIVQVHIADGGVGGKGEAANDERSASGKEICHARTDYTFRD